MHRVFHRVKAISHTVRRAIHNLKKFSAISALKLTPSVHKDLDTNILSGWRNYRMRFYFCFGSSGFGLGGGGTFGGAGFGGLAVDPGLGGLAVGPGLLGKFAGGFDPARFPGRVTGLFVGGLVN
jgi:hypothetical protein